jgi:beta-glucosidase
MDRIKNLTKDRSVFVDSVLKQMSSLEKIGQMIEVDKSSIKPGDITKYFIGSIISAGGQYPPSNTTQGWTEMADGFQQETLKTQLSIPISDPTLIHTVGCSNHRDLARQAVPKSLVMLKNEDNALPITKTDSSINVARQSADDIGMQCGGWTIEWMGKSGDIQPGTTIYTAIRGSVSPFTQVRCNSMGEFDGMAEVGIAAVGEQPYAEGVGDTNDPSLSSTDIQMITKLRAHCQKLVFLVLSGRLMVITSQYHLADAWVSVWLPGTEGSGVADVIFSDYPFSGKLPYTWPRSNNQLPLNVNNAAIGGSGSTPLFPFGLSTPG